MTDTSFDIFEEGLQDKILKLCENIKSSDELELSFGSKNYPLSLYNFNNLLKYIKFKKTDTTNLVQENIIDVLYNYDPKSNSSYRISISGFDQINTFIHNNSLLKNHMIFAKLVRAYISQDKNSSDTKIEIINKIKPRNKMIQFNDYNIKIKLSEERNDIDKSILNQFLTLNEHERLNIGFRLKQRASLILEDNEIYTYRIDITDVKTAININDLNIASNYELEVDVTFKKNIKDIKKIISRLAADTYKLEQFVQESKLLTTINERKIIIDQLQKLAYTDETEQYKDLPAMQVASVDIQHVLDIIPGRYSITDKADGDRYFLIFSNENVYLISNALSIKKIRENIGKEYDKTIIDGEYVYISTHKKFVFLAFDILFLKGEDIRNEEQLVNRLEKMYSVINYLSNTNIELKIFNDKYDIDNIINFYKKNAIDHIKKLNKLLEKENENQLIFGKYFIVPQTVGKQFDIYTLTAMLYDLYNSNTKIKNPYSLDGIVFTPLQQKYTRNLRDIKYKMLKWKPNNKNSIDFYITFLKNHDTNNIETVYDRVNESIETKLDTEKLRETDFNLNEFTNLKSSRPVYQIITLNVGRIRNNQEQPQPFMPLNDTELSQAYIYLKDGAPRDSNGNILQDKTVVEFIYNDDETVGNKFRWIPLRTRFDKTEAVQKYSRKYGNNEDIANRIWDSINHPITIEDLKLLGNSETADKEINLLKNRITKESISLSRREDKYYQLKTLLGKPLRYFHNWIKSNMIYSYCSQKTLMDLSVIAIDVLDIGIGRGGDLMKFFTPKVKSVVGIDKDAAGIFASSDGAISRYIAFKRKLPVFPRMSFMVADAGIKFDYENQSKLGDINEQNAKTMKQIFGINDKSQKHYTFDVFNVQFVIHYLLENKNTWDNFCYNINKYLRQYGYILITTLDGDMVDKEFKDGHIKHEHILEDGTSELLYDITKKYSNTSIKKLVGDENLGLAIDVHLPIFMEENVYRTEFLVKPSFLINELKTKCGMRLVETESFQNLYYVYEQFFKTTAQFESKLETRKFFADTKQFYNSDDVLAKGWFEYSKLNRYYIFQKL